MLHKNVFQIIMANWLKDNYVVIDTETTGLRTDDEIVEIAIINMRGEVLLNTLVKPTKPIPAEATCIHGITDEMVADAPTWAEVYPLVMGIISECSWLAWNSRFDARLITQTCLITGVYDDYTPAQMLASYKDVHDSQIDAKRIYSQWYGEFDRRQQNFRRQSLSSAVAQQDVQVDGAPHRALNDCLMVLGVLNKASRAKETTE